MSDYTASESLAQAQQRGLVGGASFGQISVPTMTQRLEQRKHQLQMQLADVNRVLGLMEKNPDAAELVDALSKLGHF